MVKIRLARSGAKKRPFYHIVVTDRRNRRDGSYIERLGYFNPVATGQELRLQVDAERVDHWVTIGAQVSDRVKALMKEASTEGENGAVKARAKPVSPTAAEKRGEPKAEAESAPAEKPKAEESTEKEAEAKADESSEAEAVEAKTEDSQQEAAEAKAEEKNEEAAPAEAEGTDEDADKQ